MRMAHSYEIDLSLSHKIVEIMAVKPPGTRIRIISIGASTIPGIPLKKNPFPKR